MDLQAILQPPLSTEAEMEMGDEQPKGEPFSILTSFQRRGTGDGVRDR